MAKFKDWKELEQRVVANGGVLSVWGTTLRDTYGTARIGSDVRKQIIKALDARDLEIDEPKEFYSESYVRIFKRGSAAAEIIDAVNSLGGDADDTIRRWISSPGGKLAAIKRILAEDEAA